MARLGMGIRSVGLATALVAAGAIPGCTGERPTLKDKVGTPTAACDGESVAIPEAPRVDEYGYFEPAAFTPMAINRLDVEPTLQSLRVSNSFEESDQIINGVLTKLGATAYIAELPDQSDVDPANWVVHAPEAINQQLLDVSLRHVVERLASLPEPLARALLEERDIYFTTGIATTESGVTGYILGVGDGKKPAIILSLDAEVDTGATFMWAIQSQLMNELCGGNQEAMATALTAENPGNFEYTGGDTEAAYDAYYSENGAYSSVVNIQAMASPEADLWETMKVLLLGRSSYSELSGCMPGDEGYSSIEPDSVVCAKIGIGLGFVADRFGEDTAKQLGSAMFYS